MPIFYRGAGVGTYWHINDPEVAGFTPRLPRARASRDRLMNHVARGTVTSPFVSLTRSYGVAFDYARQGQAPASSSHPALVWEVEIPDNLPPGLRLVDPVKEVARRLPGPLAALHYAHDGPQSFLLGLIAPLRFTNLLDAIPLPPGGSSPPKAANLSLELQTLVFALRDSEALVCGTLPKEWIVARHEVTQ